MVLTAKQRRELEQLVARATESAQVVRRAHVVLWSAGGVAGAEIARRVHLSAEAVSRIRRRFLETGVAGLATRPKAGRKDHAVPAATVLTTGSGLGAGIASGFAWGGCVGFETGRVAGGGADAWAGAGSAGAGAGAGDDATGGASGSA